MIVINSYCAIFHSLLFTLLMEYDMANRVVLGLCYVLYAITLVLLYQYKPSNTHRTLDYLSAICGYSVYPHLIYKGNKAIA